MGALMTFSKVINTYQSKGNLRLVGTMSSIARVRRAQGEVRWIREEVPDLLIQDLGS